MALATLSVDLVAKIAAFEQDLGKLARATEQRAEQMSRAFAGITTSLAALGVSLSAGAAFAWLKNVVEGIDAMNDLKAATGASIENISALEDVARRAGGSFETVSTGLLKFNQALNTAKPGSDAAAAFDLLNLKISELKSLDPAEALLRTATALARFADDGAKARIMQELFGKSTREVAKFLQDLAEAGKLNATVTSKQAEEANKFNDELSKLQKNSIDTARALAGPLVEGLNKVIEKFREAKAGGNSFFMSMNEIIAKQKAKSDAMFTGSFYVGNAGRGAINPAFVKPSVGDIPDKVKPEKQIRELDLSNKALASYLETLERNIQKNQDLTNTEEALIFLRKKGTGATLEEAAAILNLAKQLDLQAEQAERIKIGRQAVIDQGVDNTTYQENLKRLLDATPSAQLEKAREDMIQLTQEFEAGRISEAQYLEAVSARAGITAEELKTTKSVAEELGLTFTSAFEDAIVGGKKFSEVLKGLEQDILRIIVRKTVTEPLGGYFTGLLSSFLPSFAVGTPYVPNDMVAKIHKGERIVPAAQNRPGSNRQGTQIVQNISFIVGDVPSKTYVQQAVRAGLGQASLAQRRAEGYT